MPEREQPYGAADRVRGGLLSPDRDKRPAAEPPRLPQLHSPRPVRPKPPTEQRPRYRGIKQEIFDAALADPRAAQDAYERSHPSDEPELLMDLTNNHNARVLATVLPDMEPRLIAERVYAAGLLQTRPVAVVR